MTVSKNDFNNLLRILKLTGGKYILVEDGRPRAVLMDYEEFQELMLPEVTKKIMDQVKEIDKINLEITRAQAQDLRAEVVDPDFEKEEQDKEVTIEPIDPEVDF